MPVANRIWINFRNHFKPPNTFPFLIFLVDEEKGLVVAYVHFASGLPDCHVFRMREGKVDLIQAVIGATAKSMGWPNEPAE
jgi:hypothetical protein